MKVSSKLKACLPPHIVSSILCTPSAQGGDDDKVIWGNSSPGIFSVKSAYQKLCGNQGFPDYIWKKELVSSEPSKD